MRRGPRALLLASYVSFDGLRLQLTAKQALLQVPRDLVQSQSKLRASTTVRDTRTSPRSWKRLNCIFANENEWNVGRLDDDEEGIESGDSLADGDSQ